MSIKIIAVDMDGTFLNSEKQYNKARFLKQYAALKQKGIRFVVASGNPLATLQKYFPEICDEIAFVAENGAYVSDLGQTLRYAAYPNDVLKLMVTDLEQHFPESLILSGKNCIYVRKDMAARNLKKLEDFLINIEFVDRLAEVDAPISQLTLTTLIHSFETMKQHIYAQSYIQKQQTILVSSESDFADLVQPHQHKASGLRVLQQEWGVEDHEILAIGDNNNDVEMISMAGYGFAMDNAVASVKNVAQYMAKSNEEEGVLDVIDMVLNGVSFPQNILQKSEALL